VIFNKKSLNRCNQKPRIEGRLVHNKYVLWIFCQNFAKQIFELGCTYSKNCISITQTMLFIRIIFSYGWETAMILYKKTLIYLKNNNENKNTMFNKTEIKQKYPFIFFLKTDWSIISMFFGFSVKILQNKFLS
jgi:hypothetical protein